MRALLAIGALAGGLAFAARARAANVAPSTSSSGATAAGATLEALAVTARRVLKQPWTLPASAAPYEASIAAAELRHSIPRGLLGRLLYQESRFRADIITGAVTSSAGAVGIAQIVPRWHPDVNPRDPYASIDYAASYLASLRRQFGTWELALAAYNWGPGNLSAAIREHGEVGALERAPLETRNYVADITRDTPPAGSFA